MTLKDFHKAHNEEREKILSLEQKNERDRHFFIFAVRKELIALRKEMVAQKYTLWKDLEWLRPTAWL